MLLAPDVAVQGRGVPFPNMTDQITAACQQAEQALRLSADRYPNQRASVWVERVGSTFQFGLIVESPSEIAGRGKLFSSGYRKTFEETFAAVSAEVDAFAASKEMGLFGDAI